MGGSFGVDSASPLLVQFDHSSRECLEHRRLGVQRFGPDESDSSCGGTIGGDDIEVVEDLQVVGYKADRTNENISSTGSLDRLEEVWA